MKYVFLFGNSIFSIFKKNLDIFFKVIGAFLLPIKPMIVLVLTMIVLDTISGIWKARKIKEPITSSKLSRIVTKMILYITCLIMVYALEEYILSEFVSIFSTIEHTLTKLVALFLCTIEIVSLNENVQAVYGVNFFGLFKKYLIGLKKVSQEVKDLKDE